MKTAFSTKMILLPLCLLSACSQLNQTKKADDDIETLRALSENIAKTVPWTDALEQGRLTQNIAVTDGIEKRVALSPLSVIAGKGEDSVAPKYPVLEGFGSLDITELPAEVKAQLERFCAAFLADETTDAFMAAGSLYSLALFYNDIQEKQISFSAYRYGEPFVATDFCQVPVRFSGDKGNASVSFFFILENDAWKVDQIQIRKWELHD